MHIIIQEINSETLRVKSDTALNYRDLLVLLKDKEADVPAGVFKVAIGDYTDDSYGEMERRRKKNTHNVTFEVIPYTAPVKKKKKATEEFIEKEVEAEFPDLDRIEEPVQCGGRTKAANPCKRDAIKNGYCSLHQPKE